MKNKRKIGLLLILVLMTTQVVLGEEISKEIEKANMLLDLYQENNRSVSKENLIEAIYDVDDKMEREKLIKRKESLEMEAEEESQNIYILNRSRYNKLVVVAKEVEKANVLLNLYEEDSQSISKENLIEAIYDVDDEVEREKLIERKESLEEEMRKKQEQYKEKMSQVNVGIVMAVGVTVGMMSFAFLYLLK